jgi:hypothetical protein
LNEAAGETLRGVVWQFDEHVRPAQGFGVWRV